MPQTISDKIEELLTDILKWTRASSYAAVKGMLEGVLSTPKKMLAYQLTDGTRSRDQVRPLCQMGSNDVTKLWEKCIAMGLMEPGQGGKRKRSFDLVDFGLITDEDLAVALTTSQLAEKFIEG